MILNSRAYILVRVALCLILSPLAVTAVRAAEAAPGVPVTVTKARTADRPQLLEAHGALAAWEEISLSASTPGLPVLSATPRVGDLVRRGQLLVQFDDAAVRAEATQAEATVRAASLVRSEAREALTRQQHLREAGTVSEQMIADASAQAALAEAHLAEAETALATVRFRLSRTRITAPDDGLIAERRVLVGAVPPPGSELYRLIRQNRVEWRAELTAAQLSRLKPGLPARVQLADGSELSGTVRQLSPVLDPVTRLGTAYVDLVPHEAARPGTYVAGRFELATRTVLLVPPDCVVIRDGHTYAVTLDHDRAHLVAVTVGRTEPTATEVLDGLSEGQDVIVKGARFVAEGMKVAPSFLINRPAP